MKRRRLYALMGIGALAVALLAVAPAIGQEEEQPAVKFVASSSITPRFQAPGQPDQVLATASNGCQITGQPGTLIAMDATASSGSGGNFQPGLQGLSLGVKSPGSNANGTPCSQVDSTERLVLTPGTALTGTKFDGLRLDLEMTRDAIVVLTLDGNDPYKLYTGNSFLNLCNTNPTVSGCPGDPDNADDPNTVPYEVSSGAGELLNGCAAANSSGPNSGASDNCIWTVRPGYAFTQVAITVENAGGTASLEGGSDTGMPSLFYILQNQAPVAVNDSYSTKQDTALVVSAANGVLANDTDADGDALTAILVAGPTNGNLTLNADGSFTYTPNSNFTGSDSFTYKARDGIADSNTATVSIQVTPTLTCGRTYDFFGGEDEPNYSVRPENPDGCEKDVVNASSSTGTEEGDQFVLLETEGDGQAVFLERVEFLPQVPDPGSQIGFELFYNDIPPFDGAVELAGNCLVDPRVLAADGKTRLFDIHEDYDHPDEAYDVLPPGETTCIISAYFVVTGSETGSPLVQAEYYLYNLNDGFRTIK
ncbi:MAG TPA: cadherin-like domain-containing protein [Acidimicrobiia bacterium]|nr:cadherin-like domain-containing protein [Acidimicrobiia bacterium]